MKTTRLHSSLLFVLGVLIPSSFAEEGGRVTAANFTRAETDTYFASFVAKGAFGKLHHDREVSAVDHQTVIRTNRDTIYSFGVFDLEASPVSLTMPDPGKRYMSVLLISEDHYNPAMYYAPGTWQITREQVGTRYVALAVRTFVNPADPADVKSVHALQDAIKVDQKATGSFAVPRWDAASLAKVRKALLDLAEASGGLESAKMFGQKEKVDPVSHLMGTAAGWGGNPATEASYFGVIPEQNDGGTAYVLTLKDVPVDGFWSVSVYNKSGFFEKNALNAYTFNSVTAKPNADGSVTIHFGGDAGASNYLPIVPGWNYLVRLYRPRAEVLNGTWKVPAAQPVK
jgi:hypothetical protein